MREHSNKDKLLAEMSNNFRKLGLELDTLPPVLLDDASIRTNVDGLLVNVCQLVVHAAGWTELALKWLNKQQAGEIVAHPQMGYSWGELNDLSKSFYDEYTATPFKEARARFKNSNIFLIDKIADSDAATLFGPLLHDNFTMGGMIHRYISELYAQDHYQIRAWKKGLGWV